jgi:hypothetical protein
LRRWPGEEADEVFPTRCWWGAGEANGDLIMIGRDIPGIDAYYGHPGDNHASSVFTVRDGRRIVALRDCRTVTNGTPPTAAEHHGVGERRS